MNMDENTVKGPEEPTREAQEREAAETAKAAETGEAAQGQPEAPEAAEAPDTAAMARELEALRREKRRRLLLDEARAMLRERDISPGFAGLLLGEDSADTRRRVELFERQLSQTLQQCLAARLPAGEPRDFAAAKPQKRPPGHPQALKEKKRPPDHSDRQGGSLPAALSPACRFCKTAPAGPPPW